MTIDRLSKKSDAASASFTMKLCVQAISEILDELGVSTPVIIVGGRWDDLVAGEFAIDNPPTLKQS